MEESSNKKIVIGAIVGGIVLLIFIITTLLVIQTKSPSQSQMPKPTTQPTSAFPTSVPTSDDNKSVDIFPQVTVQQWSKNYTAPAFKATATEYVFGKPSTTSATNLATKLSISGTVQSDSELYVTHNLSEQNKQGEMLTYNLRSGAVEVRSNRGLSKGVDPETYLKNVGILDEFTSRTATYNKTDDPELIYTEYHRDWQKTGLPIFNQLGLVTLSEIDKLSNLSFITTPKDAPADPTIINTTDNTNGLARATDFNTVTVVTDKENNLLYVSSNIQPFEKLNSNQPLITNEQAYSFLEKNSYDQFYTYPTGAGTIDFSKVYPGNKGIIKNATVTDSILAYLELPSTARQESLKPYWLFRGSTQLESGYRVQFIAAISALASDHPNFAYRMPFTVYAAENTLLAQQQQMNLPTVAPPTLVPVVQSTTAPKTQPAQQAPNKKVTQPPNQPTTRPQNGAPGKPLTSSSQCVPRADQLDVRTYLGLKIGVLNRPDSVTPENALGDIYMVPTDSNSKSASVVKSALDYLNAGAIEHSMPVRTLDKFTGLDRSSSNCPIRLTGTSPSLFVYGDNGTSVSVRPEFELQYMEIPLRNGSWDIQTTREGILVNSINSSYVYYEYPTSIRFQKPEAGWNVQRSQLSQFTKELAHTLKLTPIEESRLNFEIKYATDEVSGESLFVGIIPQVEVDAKLPLSLSSLPTHSTRIHFYVAPTTTTEVQAPSLSPVTRDGISILEFGSYFSTK